MSSDAWEDRQYRSAGRDDPALKTGESGPEIKKVVFQPLEETEPVAAKRGIAHEFYGVNLNLSAELGKVTIKVRDLINLEEGSVLKLNRVADEKVMILVNENPFAHGEIVVINDRFGVRVTSLVSEDDDRDDKGNLGKES
jgi:flagellar motor switch protein FliN